MLIDANVVYSIFGALVSIIWFMLNQRIGKIEKQAHDDRVFMTASSQKVFDKLDAIKEDISDNAVKIAEKYTSKTAFHSEMDVMRDLIKEKKGP